MKTSLFLLIDRLVHFLHIERSSKIKSIHVSKANRTGRMFLPLPMQETNNRFLVVINYIVSIFYILRTYATPNLWFLQSHNEQAFLSPSKSYSWPWTGGNPPKVPCAWPQKNLGLMIIIGWCSYWITSAIFNLVCFFRGPMGMCRVESTLHTRREGLLAEAAAEMGWHGHLPVGRWKLWQWAS